MQAINLCLSFKSIFHHLLFDNEALQYEPLSVGGTGEPQEAEGVSLPSWGPLLLGSGGKLTLVLPAQRLAHGRLSVRSCYGSEQRKENSALHCEKGRNTLCWWGLGFTPSSCWQAISLRGQRDGILFLLPRGRAVWCYIT